VEKNLGLCTLSLTLKQRTPTCESVRIHNRHVSVGCSQVKSKKNAKPSATTLRISLGNFSFMFGKQNAHLATVAGEIGPVAWVNAPIPLAQSVVDLIGY